VITGRISNQRIGLEGAVHDMTSAAEGVKSRGQSDDGVAALSRPDWRVVASAGVLLVGGAAYIGQAETWKYGSLYLLGAALGLVLYHAAFGFAAGWRAFVAEGRGANLRAQMLMLAVASAIFLPVLAEGSFFGRPAGGAVAPAGVSVLVGAFLFGVGMQLGGGCASGTLYGVGGGSGRMVAPWSRSWGFPAHWACNWDFSPSSRLPPWSWRNATTAA
jgi:hypothetical protein